VRSIPYLVWSIATKGLARTYREVLPDVSRQSVDWLEQQGGVELRDLRALEVGCGFGSASALLQEKGAAVVALDIELPRVQHARADGVQAALADANALQFRDGVFDLVLCIGVLEHLPEPRRFVEEAYRCLRSGGHLYLTWTNWLSPLGGHDFAPFHYFGPRLGYRIACRVRRRQRFIQVPFETIWPIHIGPTLRMLKDSGFRIAKMTPRHFPSLSFICRVPVAREFLTVNCQLLLEKPAATR